MKKPDQSLLRIGWTIFLVECADGTYFKGLTRNLEQALHEIDSGRGGKGRGRYFKHHPERFPVTLVFVERNLPFREAYAKSSYLGELNRKQRKKLVDTKKWNNSWKLYMRGTRSVPGMYGYSKLREVPFKRPDTDTP